MHFDCDCSCFAQVVDEVPKTYTLTKKTLLISIVCCSLMFDSYQLQSLQFGPFLIIRAKFLISGDEALKAVLY